MEEFNVYCDETCHRENDGDPYMVIGCIYCPKNESKEINDRIKRLKANWHKSMFQEIKWTKLSKSTFDMAKVMVQDFFDDEDMHFRAIIIDKRKLDFKKFSKQNFQSFYYVAYFEMLKAIISPHARYNIYLDIKDTNSQERIVLLKELLDKRMNLQYNRHLINKVQHVRSHEIQILQITDLLIGAIAYDLRGLNKLKAKTDLIEIIKKQSKYDFTKTTLLREEKFNLLVFDPKGDNYE